MTRRSRIWICAAAAWVMLAVFVLCGTQCFGMPSALAEETRELLEVSISARPDELVEPGDVMLTFTIANDTELDAQNVYLSSSDGLLSEPLGRIAAGETQSFNRQHRVSLDELNEGRIGYTVSHDDPDNPTGKVNYTIHADIRRSDALPRAEFTRQFSSRYVEAGGTLVITYRIRNTGNVALTNLRVQDSLGDFTGRVDRLEVGESRTLISRATIIEDSVSSAVLDYHADGQEGELFTTVLEDVPVHLAQPALDMMFSAGYSAFSRSYADVVLLLNNTGNVDYRDICVTDDIYGGVIADALTVEAGDEPLLVSHSYPVRENRVFRWRITGVSESGEKLELTTEDAALPLPEPAGPAALTIAAETQTPRIRREGSVNITVRISNGGGADARDVLLSEAETGALRRYEIIPVDGTAERSFSFRVEESRSFNFDLRYIDETGMEHMVRCAPVEITIAPDGVLPEGAPRPFIEFTGSSIKIGGSSSFAVLLIAGFVVLLVLVIMLIVASRRARLQRQLRIAAEKQRRKEEMGKTNRFTPVRAPKNKTKGRN